MAALELDLCHGRVFLDGGSNTGDSVRAFLGGHFYTCALNSPYRLYNKAWQTPCLTPQGRASRGAG